jgi:hypothetical protein
MIKLTNILSEMIVNQPKLSPLQVIKKQIKDYMANGSQGDLDLEGAQITSLPSDLEVGGNLFLEDSLITSLPNSLKVGRSLNLEGAPITSLPNGLKVGGSLLLNDTQITSLPSDLEVGDNLYLDRTPLAQQYTKEEIRQMVPGVRKEIFI